MTESAKSNGAIVNAGKERLQKLGHRGYVGGLWEEIGRLQFEMMVRYGLRPHHCFLDIACGSLRGGIHFINYLDVGNYLGIDREESAIRSGIEKELGQVVFEEKKPEFVVSATFEFDRFSKKPDYSLAQSLFTHLTAEEIQLCLRRLSQYRAPDHRLFATFFEGDSGQNPPTADYLANFGYSREEMRAFGERCGWKATYIGEWGHPRNQMLMKYEALE
jgi:hypothetical protein